MIEPRSLLRRRRDLREIIRDAIQIYTSFFVVFFSISAVTIPLRIATNIVSELQGATAGYLLLIPDLLVSEVVAAALIAALIDIENAEEPDFGRDLDLAFSRIISILGALLRATFHTLLFAITIIGIPWAIQRFVRWAFTTQAVMFEGVDAKASLSSSAAAVEGSWWRTLGCLVALGLPAFLASALAFTFPPNPIAVTSTAIAALGAVILPFGIISSTLLYFDLKERKAEVQTPARSSEEEIA